jgi:putative oxidoreductase
MDAAVAPVSAVGRILIALIFVRAGINKLGTIAATSATMRSHGIPYPDLLVWGAVLVELGAGWCWWQVFTRAGQHWRCSFIRWLIFHAYWAAPEATARTEAAFFFGHLSMMGGMLYVVAFGAGPYSIDALMGRWTSAPVSATTRNRL